MSVHVLHRRHADLIPRLDAALKAMRKDGRLAALLASLANLCFGRCLKEITVLRISNAFQNALIA